MQRVPFVFLGTGQLPKTVVIASMSKPPHRIVITIAWASSIPGSVSMMTLTTPPFGVHYQECGR